MLQTAMDEYYQALKQGQKELKELTAAGKDPNPKVLDEILPENGTESVVDLGLVEIPAERIVGVKSAGRITAFTASFRPLLDSKSEFGLKWINLCAAHLGEVGITDPIVCYEYLGDFYIQEGNKRVSVLKHFDSPRIPGVVKRILPPVSQDPRIVAYYEFLDFYKVSRLYCIQFRRPGDYKKLMSHLNLSATEVWEEDQRRTVNAYFHYFRDAFCALNTKYADILPEEALLLWLELYPFQDLGKLTSANLKKSIAAIWEDILSASTDAVLVQTTPTDKKSSLLNRLALSMDQLKVAFVHQLDSSSSAWVLGHEDGRRHIENTFGEEILVSSYFGASTPELADQLIEQAVAEGAQVVFTTAPPLSKATLKAAVKYPKIRFLNCSVDQAYSSIRTYYGRIYEAKFITGAIAGAMAGEDRIGYIASYPIFGVPASINAFALGAQMTNPRAQIELRWSCVAGTPQADFLANNVRVISNRDAPTNAKMYLDFCSYGTYLVDDRGEMVPLASPVWYWGKFYEFVVQSILSGGWIREKGDTTALNYWLGMDSGVIDVTFSDKIPEGLRQLCQILKAGMADGSIDAFFRKITAQDGSLKNDGTRHFTPDELLHMDWLCSNVIGDIPKFEDILPISQNMVRELGIYRDRIPDKKEEQSREDLDHLR